METEEVEVKRFIFGLFEIFPEINKILIQHLNDFDELLPYVFMGDVVRFLDANLDALIADGRLDLLIDYLELWSSKDKIEIDNLISLGFIENFVGGGRAILTILQKFGPCVATKNEILIEAVKHSFLNR